jgi:hypothetical protein
MCGRELPEEFSAFSMHDLSVRVIEKKLKTHNWIVQVNSDNIDTYCSKECAK